MQRLNSFVTAIVAGALIGATARSQDQAPRPDLNKEPTLFVVGYAHLDTQWRWTYPQTIREYLARTLHDNFALFEKHPSYVFNFSGARRYEMFKEYYPADFERLKTYVATRRWFPCGSSMDENDANTPSAESLIRNVLYGNRFFRRELGIASDEYMLPDCFGFPAALPSALAHCGIKGFSTQKLTWGSVVGIPFNVGVWIGPDGHSVIAALNPGQYDGNVQENLATSERWLKRINDNAKTSGVLADYHYYGTGDVGGAPREASVAMVEKSLATQGSVRVSAGRADDLFNAVTPAMREKLPRYTGELELTEHSAGSATSQAFMKFCNRKNEFLADAAERAAVLAWWLGGRAYPAQKLEAAWTLVLGSQMHDIVSGTALAKGYEYAWNDEALAANQFAAVLTDGVEVVAGQLDTRGVGTALVLFNPLSVARVDVVEAEIPSAVATAGARVIGSDGQELAAQVVGSTPKSVRIAFLAKMPPVGFAAYTAQLANKGTSANSELHVEERQLENARYVVKLDDDGDVSSIFDKRANRELLAAPVRLGLYYENPKNWPAWNMDWTDRQQPARDFVGGPAQFRIVERGPARIAVEVSRELNGSTFVQRIRLSAGGDRVEFDTDIAWVTRERSLRAEFPLSVSNPKATFDIQSGVIERGNAQPKQYEYQCQQWMDLTDAKGDYGVTISNDSKYGCDKPSDTTLRLTLLHTPGTRGGYDDQATQDLGRHHVLYAISGHAGDWRQGRSAIEAARLNQPPLAFRTTAHDGPLGKAFALASVSDDNVRIQALKKAEDSDEVIVRVRELSGRSAKEVRINFSKPITHAREVDGQERELGPATVRDGAVIADIGGYELRAFAVKLGAAPAKVPQSQSTPLALAFDADVISTNDKRADGSMDAHGSTLPAEQLPATIAAEDALFKLGATSDGQKNALTCRGQELALPQGDFERVYLLAASDGEVRTQVAVDGKSVEVRFPDWRHHIGQWDSRSWKGDGPQITGIEPGFIDLDPVAWFCSHHHEAAGDADYEYCYLRKIAIDLPKGAKTLRLPNDEHIKVLAASAVHSGTARVVAALPLFDTLDDHKQDGPQIVPSTGSFSDVVDLRIEPRLYWRADAIRYTLDGSEPSATSSTYTSALLLDHSATIKAAVLGRNGRLGPIVSAKLEVNDVTPPSVKKVAPAYGSTLLHVHFSEPVEPSSAAAQNFALDPKLEIRSADIAEDKREVVLHLAAAAELDRTYHLKISGVRDASPAHNAMQATLVDIAVKGPVFKQAEVTHEQMGSEIHDVAGLPVKAGDAWTLNMFVRVAKQPDDRTIIAGFGQCEQTSDGAARYMTKFPRGIHFWSHNRDVEGRTPLELGKWQMLSATYDGHVARLFKDAKQIGEREVEFVDDQNAVRFAPPDPWEHKRQFEGEIREFSIWSEALSEDALRAILSATALH